MNEKIAKRLEELRQFHEFCIEQRLPAIGENKAEWLLDRILFHKPNKILEFGMAGGYSATILSSFNDNSKIYTCDINTRIMPVARFAFKLYSVDADIFEGNGINMAEKLADDEKNHETFDFVFLDFAKKSYLAVYENIFKLLKPNGVLVADNVMHPSTINFLNKIKADKRYSTEIIDIKDGLTYSIKK